MPLVSWGEKRPRLGPRSPGTVFTIHRWRDSFTTACGKRIPQYAAYHPDLGFRCRKCFDA